MSEQDHMETIARRAQALQQQIDDAGMGPPACPRCAALEAEVRRLREMITGNEMLIKTYQTMVRELRADHDSARALLGEFAALRTCDCCPYHLWDEKGGAADLLRRAEAEAAGGAG